MLHKNLKSNAGLANSQTLRTQVSHVFMSIYAGFKFECLSIKIRLNPTPLLRSKLPTDAARSAFEMLTRSQAGPAAASGQLFR